MSTAVVDAQSIKQIPPSLLQTLPAGAAPSGISTNFVDPPTLVPAVLGVGTSFLTLALIYFSIRAWTKLAINKRCSWDDLTCALGFLFALAMYAGIVLGCDKGSLGRHVWDVTLANYLGNASLVQSYITTVMAVPALGLIKSSLFIQYYTLFWPLRWVRVSVWIGATISTLFYTACAIAAFILNSPWPGESMLDAILSWHYFAFSRFSIAIGAVGMCVDIYLLILPIKAVSTLNMRLGKKVGLSIVFLTGTLAVIASITGLYYRVRLQENITDASWRVAYIHIWGQVETFAGVACSSMPSVYKFFGRYSFPIDSLKNSLQHHLSHLLKSNPTRERLSDFEQSNATQDDKQGNSTTAKGYPLRELRLNAESVRKVDPWPRSWTS